MEDVGPVICEPDTVPQVKFGLQTQQLTKHALPVTHRLEIAKA